MAVLLPPTQCYYIRQPQVTQTAEQPAVSEAALLWHVVHTDDLTRCRSRIIRPLSL